MNNSSITEIKDEVKKANEELKETMNPLHSPLIEYYLSLIHISEPTRPY